MFTGLPTTFHGKLCFALVMVPIAGAYLTYCAFRIPYRYMKGEPSVMDFAWDANVTTNPRNIQWYANDPSRRFGVELARNPNTPTDILLALRDWDPQTRIEAEWALSGRGVTLPTMSR